MSPGTRHPLHARHDVAPGRRAARRRLASHGRDMANMAPRRGDVRWRASCEPRGCPHHGDRDAPLPSDRPIEGLPVEPRAGRVRCLLRHGLARAIGYFRDGATQVNHEGPERAVVVRVLHDVRALKVMQVCGRRACGRRAPCVGRADVQRDGVVPVMKASARSARFHPSGEVPSRRQRATWSAGIRSGADCGVTLTTPGGRHSRIASATADSMRRPRGT